MSLPALFDRLSDEQRESALQRFEQVEVDFGTSLMEEGDEDPSLICILAGKVEISTEGVDLATAGPGDLIGEMALFGDGLRMATVRTTTPCTFLLLDRDGYESLRDSRNPVAQSIERAALNLLTERLRAVNRKITGLAHGVEAGKATPAPSLIRRVARLFGAPGGRRDAPRVDRLRALQVSPLFREVPEASLSALASKMQAFTFPGGEFVCSQGDRGEEMFILAEGVIEVILALDDGRVEPLATLDPGDAFGMVSLVADWPRTASCVSRGDVVALSLQRQVFAGLLEDSEGAGSGLRGAMIRALIDQLAYANGQLLMLDLERRRAKGEHLFEAASINAAFEVYSDRIHTKAKEG